FHLARIERAVRSSRRRRCTGPGPAAESWDSHVLSSFGWRWLTPGAAPVARLPQVHEPQCGESAFPPSETPRAERTRSQPILDMPVATEDPCDRDSRSSVTLQSTNTTCFAVDGDLTRPRFTQAVEPRHAASKFHDYTLCRIYRPSEIVRCGVLRNL